MTGDPPDPPESFTDEERGLSRRVFALPQIEELHYDAVTLLVRSATTARGFNAAIADARARNLTLAFDVEEEIGEETQLLEQLLGDCLITRSHAQRLGLLPLGLAGAGDDA